MILDRVFATPKALTAARFLLALACAGAGAVVSVVAGLPAPILIGAMAGTFIAALGGMPVAFPRAMQTAVVWAIGISVGSACNVETLGLIARNWPTVAGLLLGQIITLLIVALVLRAVVGVKLDTAVLSAFPGHIEVAIQQAARLGGRELQHVALFQGLRLVILVAALPALVASVAAGEQPESVAGVSWLNLLLVSGSGVVGALVTARLRLPAGVILGSMGGAAAVTLIGFPVGRLPDTLAQGILLFSGTMIGCQFVGCRLSSLARVLPGSMLGVTIAIGLMATLAVGVGWWLGVPYGQMILAYAPGGADVMPILALTMGLDPAFVGLHHVARVMCTAIMLPIILKLLAV